MYLVYDRLAAILPCMFPIIQTRCEFHDALQTDITPFHSEYPRLSHLKRGVHPALLPCLHDIRSSRVTWFYYCTYARALFITSRQL